MPYVQWFRACLNTEVNVMPPSAQEMTTAQLGKRIDRVEDDLGKLTVQSATTNTTVEGMRGDMAVMFTKLDTAIEQSSGNAAVKGYIPLTFVYAAMAIFVSLLSVGITVLTFTSTAIRADMLDDAEKDELKFKAVATQMGQDDVREDKDRERFESLVVVLGEYREGMAETTATHKADIGENAAEISRLTNWQRPFLEDWGKSQAHVGLLLDRVQALEKVRNR